MEMKIGPKPFIIAELSGNHNGDLCTALKLICAAKRAGCDAVKIQCYEPADLCDQANNHIYEKCKIPREWYEHLFNCATAVGIPLFSSVFAVRSVEFLEQFGCPAYKLASPESTRLPEETYWDLREKIKWKSKALFASSGRKDMEFIGGLYPDVLFYCPAGHPAKLCDADAEVLGKIGCIRGFSDHTADILSPLAMIGAGARVIEKHFKLDDDCIDAAFSLNPAQMATLCRLAHR